MSAAVIGLVGVLVGAVIAAGWGYIAEIRRDLGAGVVAARLVLDEFENGKGTSEWRSHRDALAGVLNFRQWSAVADAVNAKDAGGVTAAQAQALKDALWPLCQGRRYHWWQRRLDIFRRSNRPPAG